MCLQHSHVNILLVHTLKGISRNKAYPHVVCHFSANGENNIHLVFGLNYHLGKNVCTHTKTEQFDELRPSRKIYGTVGGTVTTMDKSKPGFH